MTVLAHYDAACRSLALAKSTDEVREIRDKAEAMRAYARQSKNKQLEVDATEIRMRAERRIGELMAAQREAGGLAQPGPRAEIGSETDPNYWPTLAEAGIDKHLADRARKLAAVPEAEFEERLAGWRGRIAEENERVTLDLLASGDKHVRGTFGTGENEWYTPPEYLEAARTVLGGIDLDPASSEVAQARVKAGSYFTKADDGLTRPWPGRVWLNPPYTQPDIAQFVGKLVEEVMAGRTTAAVLLTHNYTDTAWFHLAASVCTAICFTRGRVAFLDPEGKAAAPTQGQAFFFYGGALSVFRSRFEAFGLVVTRSVRSA